MYDVAHAQERVVIVSPFVTVKRVQWIKEALQRCAQNRTHMMIVTRKPDSLPASSQHAAETAISMLRNAGAEVICREGIHQKFAMVDDRIVWYGSINLLSFGASQESIIRLVSSSIARALLDNH